MEPDITTITGQSHVSLAEIDPSSTGALDEHQADTRLAELESELRDLHETMMAAESHALLMILEGMDAAGKDVTIENVHAAFNPQAARVKAFKAPTGDEEKHHFLWRVNPALPKFGEVVTFDRSYHEQALPKDLEGDVDGEARQRRFEHINAFERMLQDEGTIVVKIFLHIGKDAQAERLEERQQDIGQAWKLSADDWEKREQWDMYMQAYEEMMNVCATPEIPWYVVPAEERWYHNAVIAEILAERLRPFRTEWEAARERIGKENQEAAEQARKDAS